MVALHVWQRGDQRAPHKPLLLLMAVGWAVDGAPRLIRYADANDMLGRLLRDFGPARSAVHPEYPFWRLYNDGLRKVSTTKPIRVRKGNRDPSRN